MHRAAQSPHRAERVGGALGERTELAGEPDERLAPFGEVAGLAEVPVVAAIGPLVHLAPGRHAERGGPLRRRVELHLCACRDGQARVAPRQIEVMHPVAEEIPVGEDTRSRLQVHLELQAALRRVRRRSHAQLHHALAHGRGVGEAGQMPDGVVGGHETGAQASPMSIG